jgi:hypothetical protein
MINFFKKNRRKFRSVFSTWFQSFLAFELALHAKDLITKDVVIPAIMAAIIPVILRWANPKDSFPD